MNTHYKLSTERLTHFQCEDCNKWWSIGDAPNRSYWYCPWCGEYLTQAKRETNFGADYMGCDYLELARRLIPGASDDFLGQVLWNITSYPFGSTLQIARQLKKVARDKLLPCGHRAESVRGDRTRYCAECEVEAGVEREREAI